MIYCENSAAISVSIHNIGNKVNGENIHFSKSNIKLDNTLSEILVQYFTSPFKSNEYFNLYHESDIELNEVFTYVSNIFDNAESLHEQSINLAKHLYEQSNHPKIKSGEFYVVYFEECVIDGETVDAVGLFKSENKDTFIKIDPSSDGFELECQHGININKLDKGSLIFNSERDNGYIVAVVDNTNKGGEARYWIDDFLHVRQRQDEYHNTQNMLSMCKSFVTKELPQHFDLSKADQADLLNKSVTFFKDKDSFDIGEFTEEVIEQPEVIERFNQFKDDYQKDRDIDIADRFDISDTAVKKQARSFKSIIKLDKNFHIYIHGDKDKIERGEDDTKGKYYKIYYTEES